VAAAEEVAELVEDLVADASEAVAAEVEE